MAEKITGAQALIRALEHEQVDLMFGYPGGCILPAYDSLTGGRLLFPPRFRITNLPKHYRTRKNCHG